VSGEHKCQEAFWSAKLVSAFLCFCIVTIIAGLVLNMVSTSSLVQYIYSTTHVVFPFAKPTWNVANTCESFDGLPPLLNHTPGKFKVLRKNARIEAGSREYKEGKC
jgi:hypothetical protein